MLERELELTHQYWSIRMLNKAQVSSQSQSVAGVRPEMCSTVGSRHNCVGRQLITNLQVNQAHTA
jgi:hypothetical protein